MSIRTPIADRVCRSVFGPGFGGGGGGGAQPGDNEPAQFVSPRPLIEIPLTTISAGVGTLRSSGYREPGDGGHGFYRRVAVEPGHPGKVQSADGAWWELIPENGYVNVLQFGATRAFVDTRAEALALAFSTQAFLDAIAYGTWDFLTFSNRTAGSARVLVPAGSYHCGRLDVRNQIFLEGAVGAGVNEPASRIFFDQGSAGLTLHDADTTNDVRVKGSGLGTANGSVVRNLGLIGDRSFVFDENASGLIIRSQVRIQGVYVADFDGHGILILAGSGPGGNANTTGIDGVTVSFPVGNGIHIEGTDANALDIYQPNCIGGRWGVYDDSLAGNVIIGGHFDAQGGTGCHYNGSRYMAHPKATDAQLVATTPGTNPAVWARTRAGGAGSGRYVEWTGADPEGTFTPGGPYCVANDNAWTRIVGGWTEIGLPPFIGNRGLVWGNGPGGADGFGGTGFVMEAGGKMYGALDVETDSKIVMFTGATFEIGNYALRQWTPGNLNVIAFERSNELPLGITDDSNGLGLHFGYPGADVSVGSAFGLRGFYLGSRSSLTGVNLDSGTENGAGQDRGAGDIIFRSDTGPGDNFAWLYTGQHVGGSGMPPVVELWNVPAVDRAPLLPGFDLASLPAADAGNEGTIAYCTDGDGGAESVAVSDGTAWAHIPLRDPRLFYLAAEGQTASDVAFDLAASNYLTVEPTGDITIDITNLDTGEGLRSGLMLITGGGDHALSFTLAGGAGTVTWAGGAPPGFSIGTGRDLIAVVPLASGEVLLKLSDGGI